MIVDAHQHFWQLSQKFDYSWLDAPEVEPIRRDFLPEHLEPHIRRVGVDRTILVQTQHNTQENDWALELAERHEFIGGVVGWVDLASGQCEEQLLEAMDRPKFVGARHVTQDEPDDDFIVRPDVIRGLKVLQKHGVPFDLLFYPRHLKHAATLARELPDLPMVLDHLGKPPIRLASMEGWIDDFRAAARFPNLFCKLSGMITEADHRNWKPADLQPYVETALEAFGPERCLFGSDWPVCELAGSYEEVHTGLVAALGPLGDSERDAIFGGTACRFYNLEDNVT